MEEATEKWQVLTFWTCLPPELLGAECLESRSFASHSSADEEAEAQWGQVIHLGLSWLQVNSRINLPHGLWLHAQDSFGYAMSALIGNGSPKRTCESCKERAYLSPDVGLGDFIGRHLNTGAKKSLQYPESNKTFANNTSLREMGLTGAEFSRGQGGSS